MRLLLDTHVWIWSRLAPELLGEIPRAALLDRRNELWLSPISVWETLILIEKGRLAVKASGVSWIESALARVPMRECPITNQVALHSRSIDLPHQDPADRFLAATAVVYDLTLLTADRRLLELSTIPTMSAG